MDRERRRMGLGWYSSAQAFYFNLVGILQVTDMIYATILAIMQVVALDIRDPFGLNLNKYKCVFLGVITINMSQRVLILQSDPTTGETLSNYFKGKGDKVLVTSDFAKVCQYVKRVKLDLIFVDLHMPGDEWLRAIKCIQKHSPNVNLIVTNKHMDVRRELIARDHGVRVFLRFPFNRVWIENAIHELNNPQAKLEENAPDKGRLPRIKVPMRTKITLPYVFLALFFALASAFVASRYVFESIQDRFLIQLIDTGKLTADWMVQEESRILETVRLLANTEGVAPAIVAQDADRLREIILPVVINYGEDAVNIIDSQGVSTISIKRVLGGGVNDYEILTGDTSLGNMEIVDKILMGDTDQHGDKYAGVARIPSGDYLYIMGPIMDVEGSTVGIVAVGKALPTLVHQIREDTLGHVSIYGLDGSFTTTTLLVQEDVSPISNMLISQLVHNQDEESSIRDLSIASASYSELLGPWEVRGGQDLGIIGTSLAKNYLARPTMVTRVQIFLIVIVAVLGVITLGVVLAHQITNPLSQIVRATMEVAEGNLEVKVPSHGNDEVMVLAHTFNYMVSGLQEGFIYRDLLGRTVSPQVREALRHSFASGNVRLEGQNSVGTVLISDIRDFTAISEKEEPTTVLNWLNEYFGEVVPVITSLGGVVDKFEGDSMLAFFGILPTPLPADESAYYACKAAVDMQKVIEKINIRRSNRGEAPLVTGVGVNTGILTAGGLGTSDRLNYTVIGDTVNTTQRIEGFTHEFGESGIIVSETTLSAMKKHRDEFIFEPLGEHSLKGKMELMWLYRLYPLESGKV